MLDPKEYAFCCLGVLQNQQGLLIDGPVSKQMKQEGYSDSTNAFPTDPDIFKYKFFASLNDKGLSFEDIALIIEFIAIYPEETIESITWVRELAFDQRSLWVDNLRHNYPHQARKSLARKFHGRFKWRTR